MTRQLKMMICLFTFVGMLICRDLQGQADQLETQRRAVVKLRINRQGSTETAAGIVVGSDQQNVFIATAFHAVNDSSDSPKIQSVFVEFYGSPKSVSAQVEENHDEVLDLAVIRVPGNALPHGLPQLPRKDVSPDILIHIIGHPASGDWSVWPGNVQNENAASGDPRHFITNRDASLAGGFSGGAVLDSRGNLLGMHTSTNVSYGVALKCQEIVTQLGAWRIPTNNLIMVTNPEPESVLKPASDNQTLTGRWTGTYQLKIDKWKHTYLIDLDLDETGRRVTGTLHGTNDQSVHWTQEIEGTRSTAGDVTLIAKPAIRMRMTINFNGKLTPDGKTIDGTMLLPPTSQANGTEGRFSISRQ